MKKNNTNFGLSNRDCETIYNAVRRFPEISKAVIFGSRALGNYKKSSDVDIALKGKDVSLDTVSNLSSILNEESPLPYYFDIVNFNTIMNAELISHIHTHGKILYPLQV